MRNSLMIAALAVLITSGCKKSDGEEEKTTGAKVTSTMSPTATPANVSSEVPITSSSTEAIELFKQARDLQENHRMAAARERLARAVELDPDFAQARALLGKLLPLDEGKAHLERANQLAARLPEPERLLVTAMIAGGEEADAALDALAKKTTGDWRVKMMVARRHLQRGDIDSARSAFEDAARLEPEAPYPHNNLAYIYADQGDWDKAIRSAERYAELVPGEPNPLDTKAEILLLAGKLEQAEAAFREAVKMAPDFAIAREGVAATMFHRDNWEGGLAELRAAVDAAAGPERAKLQHKLGWAYLASGKDKEADAAFAAANELTKASPGMIKIQQAEVALHRDRFAEAAKLAAAGVSALASDGVPAKKQRWGQALQAVALARAGKVAPAQKLLASLAAGGTDHYVHFAGGHVHLASGDTEASLAALSELEHDKWFSARARLLSAEALDKAGKGAEAKKIRAELASHYARDIQSILVRVEAEKAGSS